ncbi:MAG: oxidoreductase [Gammaproteobacteria bacterium]|nr:oxidoreductase [Gammaproteobacteria bacterium]|tara:strand:+ start:5142 stop:5906 length:765 start_codon:yes stop_codon:yes gene_type:complete
MDRLKDKVAVITGGAGGIGRAAGKLFAAEGASVLLVDLDEDALKQAVAESGSNRVSYFVGDVTRAADNQAMFETATERYGGVDVFLANAGIEGDVKSIVEYDEDRFDQVLGVNVKGVFLGLKSAIPAMQARGGGSVVITSSVAGVTGAAGVSAYVTSKHAVIGLMRTAAKECAPLNIRVNTVNPSPVETRMMRSLEEGMLPGSAEAAKEAMTASIPMGRYGTPDEIARVMLFLASEDSAWITGSVYMADGGFTA